MKEKLKGNLNQQIPRKEIYAEQGMKCNEAIVMNNVYYQS